MKILTTEKIQEVLHEALGRIGNIEECALLDFPDYLNIGDRLIWLGTVFYLTDVLKTKIKYAASIKGFSESEMEKQIGCAPILLQGGGNLGDTWFEYQAFRERIITKYRDRPIVILPQSIYFVNTDNLKKAADIFNSHPNLTLFARENYSYDLASQHFTNCRVIKAPDMAFQMVNMPGLSFKLPQKRSILYHCRGDRELNQTFSPSAIELQNTVVEDWLSYKWIVRENAKAGIWRLPGMVRLFREGWQKGLSNPAMWRSRQMWERHPYPAKFDTLYNPAIHKDSWSLMHAGIYQFKQYPLVITNRLHGHILCLLLRIPHIFLPNSYHKNESFYQTWTRDLPLCRFVKDASQIKDAAKQLLEVYDRV